jgi:hypothetical protein
VRDPCKCFAEADWRAPVASSHCIDVPCVAPVVRSGPIPRYGTLGTRGLQAAYTVPSLGYRRSNPRPRSLHGRPILRQRVRSACRLPDRLRVLGFHGSTELHRSPSIRSDILEGLREKRRAPARSACDDQLAEGLRSHKGRGAAHRGGQLPAQSAGFPHPADIL